MIGRGNQTTLYAKEKQVILHHKKLIPVPGAIGAFFYDAQKDVSTHDEIQRSIWNLGGDAPFASVLGMVDIRFKTKFQEMVFQKCPQPFIETAPFQLENGLWVIDYWRKIFKDGKLSAIAGNTKVVKPPLSKVA